MTEKTKEFIKKAKRVHGNRYDYSSVEYQDCKTKIEIKCKEHGIFEQIPRNHLSSANCPRCARASGSNKQKMSKDEFIEKAIKVHGDKYSFDKVKYVNNAIKVTLTCSVHGDFEITPKDLIGKENGCKRCGIEQRKQKRTLTLEEFITKANSVHSNLYDYKKTVYVNSRTKITIICKEHGKFKMTPNYHLKGNGCPTCRSNGDIEIKKKDKKRNSYTTESFIKKAKKIHNNKYDYSKVKYVNISTKVTIRCPVHGEFKQRPSTHITMKIGCPKCSYQKLAIKKSMTKEEFIKKANKRHNNKYTYDKTVYVNNRTPIIITCPEHGDFEQIPTTHLEPCGCPKCSYVIRGKKLSLSLEEFIKRANKVHGSKYDYRKVKYINLNTKVKIICRKHGTFRQRPSVHIFRADGCPKCSHCGYSKPAIEWLKCIADMDHIDIKHAENGGEYTIPNTKLRVDGYHVESKTVYEFYGCFFHGCKECFDPKDNNEVSSETYAKLYEKTKKREKLIKEKGYKICKIWKHEWDIWRTRPVIINILRRNELLQEIAYSLLDGLEINTEDDIYLIKNLIYTADSSQLNIFITQLVKAMMTNDDVTYHLFKKRCKKVRQEMELALDIFHV